MCGAGCRKFVSNGGAAWECADGFLIAAAVLIANNNGNYVRVCAVKRRSTTQNYGRFWQRSTILLRRLLLLLVLLLLRRYREEKSRDCVVQSGRERCWSVQWAAGSPTIPHTTSEMGFDFPPQSH